MSKIDLSDIKDDEFEKTSSFTDLMSRKEKKERKKLKQESEENDILDIEEMIDEKRKNTKDLTNTLEKAKEEYNNKYEKDIAKDIKTEEQQKEENLDKTKVLDLTRAMKFNFEETKKENVKKKGVSVLNVIGEVNLLCIGYYIYLLVFTSYQDKQENYLITGGIIVLLVLLFGLSAVTGKKLSKFFYILNILAIIGFVGFNIYTLFY